MIITANSLTLDEYIEKLVKLKNKHGGSCPVMTAAYDYPEGANYPHYIDAKRATAYTPEGCIVLS